MEALPKYEDIDIPKMIDNIADRAHGFAAGNPNDVLITMSDFTWQFIVRWYKEQGPVFPAEPNGKRSVHGYDVTLHQINPPAGNLRRTGEHYGDIDEIIIRSLAVTVGIKSAIRWRDFPKKNDIPTASTADPINPGHYKRGGVDVIDILKAKLTEEEYQGFLKGNVIKYTLRAGMKNGAEDLKKAAWYSSMLAGKDPQ